MAHEEEALEALDSKATQAQIIEKVNEIIERLNHMWYPDHGD